MREFETAFDRKEKEEEEGEKKQTRLIVMLNLQVNDTITMPTPAIAMETSFYCIDRLKKSPPPPNQHHHHHPGEVWRVCTTLTRRPIKSRFCSSGPGRRK